MSLEAGNAVVASEPDGLHVAVVSEEGGPDEAEEVATEEEEDACDGGEADDEGVVQEPHQQRWHL